MTTQCSEPIVNTIIPRLKCKVKKIAIFLPVPYRGGSLKGSKNIAKMIHMGSREQNEPVEIVFSCVQGSYDVKEDFSDLLELGIAVRETSWRKISKNELKFMGNFRKIPEDLNSDEYLLPTDGMNNFSDCDFWLLISDRTDPPLAPVTPYGIVVYDYIQRYIPEMFGPTLEKGYLTTARNASFVITTTPHTFNDAIQYAGIDPKKVSLFPMEFRPPALPGFKKNLHNKDFFLWVTNPAHHKNHLRAYKAIERYYFEENGELDLLIIGPNTNFFCDPTNPIPHVREVAQSLEKNFSLKNKIHILGEVSDSEYSHYLSQAKFLWHPTLIDNGTFCVVEAAYLKVPSLSSDYPAMRYMNDRFRLNLSFSDPYSIDDMAKKLKKMEIDNSQKKLHLPDRGYFEHFTTEHLATDFWILFRQFLIRI